MSTNEPKSIEFKAKNTPAEPVPVKVSDVPEKKEEKLKSKKAATNKPDLSNLKSWTMDIRETEPYKSKLSADNLSELFKSYQARGLKIDHLYCTDKQAEQIKKMGNYDSVELTVE